MSSIVERLRDSKHKGVDFNRTYDHEADWINNALREHAARPFKAIICDAGRAACADAMQPDDCSDGNPLFGAATSCDVTSTADEIADALHTFTAVSREVDIVDPYFDLRPTEGNSNGESSICLIFCFGIGGIGAVLYNLVTGRRLRGVPEVERRSSQHRLHYWALATPFLVFSILYPFPWNPIYPSIIAMALGAIAAILCRPDLVGKTWVGALLFLGYYTLFLLGLEWTAPGYIERIWNLADLSGLGVAGFPIEELVFAAAFGAYWAGAYDHFTWQKLVPAGN